MKEKNKKDITLIIQGYNDEKKILVSRLSILPTNNSTIATRFSVENRLREIDKTIKEL